MKSLICLIALFIFVTPLFAQDNSSKSSQDQENESKKEIVQLNPNYLVKTLSPIKTVPNNKLKATTLAKDKTEQVPEYNLELEIKKIQDHIRKIELQLEKSKVSQESNLESEELQFLLKKLNTKLSSLKE